MQKNILVVEDEMINALFLKQVIIESGNICCGIVRSGEEAIQVAIENNPDLIFMDIYLEDDIDGIDAAISIQNIKFIPVIFITASTDIETIKKAENLNNYIIRKPFREEDIVDKMTNLLSYS